MALAEVQDHIGLSKVATPYSQVLGRTEVIPNQDASKSRLIQQYIGPIIVYFLLTIRHQAYSIAKRGLSCSLQNDKNNLSTFNVMISRLFSNECISFYKLHQNVGRMRR